MSWEIWTWRENLFFYNLRDFDIFAIRATQILIQNDAILQHLFLTLSNIHQTEIIASKILIVWVEIKIWNIHGTETNFWAVI